MIRQTIEEATLGDDEFEPRKSSRKTLEELLSKQIPQSVVHQVPRSYDIVGDIAILDLNYDLAPNEKMIAEALLEIHSNVRAVFAKAGSISGTDRIRPLRHIAGEQRMVTSHREFGCMFRVDLGKVFFSPRLSTEHQRVACQVADGETVVDMFAGVGPFSILIAKTVKNVTVDAIDSNPEAVKMIEENVRINKVSSKVRVHSGDAGSVVRHHLMHKATRVVMNHPSSSKEFVAAACDAMVRSVGILHYYAFGEGEDPESKVQYELESALKASGNELRDVFASRKVREVAPMKWQIAIDAKIIPRQ